MPRYLLGNKSKPEFNRVKDFPLWRCLPARNVFFNGVQATTEVLFTAILVSQKPFHQRCASDNRCPVTMLASQKRFPIVCKRQRGSWMYSNQISINLRLSTADCLDNVDVSIKSRGRPQNEQKEQDEAKLNIDCLLPHVQEISTKSPRGLSRQIPSSFHSQGYQIISYTHIRVLAPSQGCLLSCQESFVALLYLPCFHAPHHIVCCWSALPIIVVSVKVLEIWQRKLFRPCAAWRIESLYTRGRHGTISHGNISPRS